ncbi:MAG: GAF domain-containing protein [Deltaproteobacteria bacterium]|nr:GAF domain-containing protein [Deltaproteobacteria bacterium]MBW2015870.1 GAF domain-containing protein [Deltaproteobacteria bacterium]MBW2129623.1 GAF domain-containing protein [Deltaproteobacteria bacterium]MBW2303953.1 GAF domain-containing protein [Deltaproteobacteria bacterium]
MKPQTKRRFYLNEFKAISHAISTYEDFNLLVNHIAEGTARSFRAKGCSIMIFDERENQLFTVGSYGISDAYLHKGPIFADEKYCSFFSGEPIFVKDMSTDPRIHYPEEAVKEGITSMLCVPIKHRRNVIGSIRIYQSESRPFHPEDVSAMCVLAEQLGLVIENNGLRNFAEKIKTAVESLPQRVLEDL